MRIDEITEFPDGTHVVGLLYRPTFEQEMKTWFSERNKRRTCCDYCDNYANYHIGVGFFYPYYDHYYHNVCKRHLFIRKCEQKKEIVNEQKKVESPMFKCDFCDDVAGYYVRTGPGDSLDFINEHFENEDIYKRRHFVCRKHIKITRYDNFRVSEWYSTHMRSW